MDEIHDEVSFHLYLEYFFFCAGSFSELPLVPQIAEVIKEDLWPNPLTYFSHVTSLLPYLSILDNKFGY